MDSLLFGEVLEHYSEILQKELDSEGKDDTLSLRSLMRDKDEKPDLPDDDDDDEFLKLHDGNYLKAKEAGEVDSPKRTTDIWLPKPNDDRRWKSVGSMGGEANFIFGEANQLLRHS